MEEKKKDYLNALAKAHIDSTKLGFKIGNYFFTFLLIASIVLAISGSFSVAIYGFVFVCFYFLIIRPFQKFYLARIDKNINEE